MSVKYYLVGGSVRDELLSIKSNDLDYAVEAQNYNEMRDSIISRGGEIFLERPEFFTIRAKVPNFGCADFTLCRKDGFYSDCRHPDHVDVGTILEDLARRDATINAIAKDENGNLIDPFDGAYDIRMKLIRAVGEAKDRVEEDPLRLLRYVRFCITKDMHLHTDIRILLGDGKYIRMLQTLSVERIYEELKKCFLHNTAQTLEILEIYPKLRTFLFTRTPIKLVPKIFAE